METNLELYHYGRKGMKWYQNIFGSKKSGSGKRASDGDTVKAAPPKQKKQKPKRLRDMTEAELNSRIKRLELEKRYKDLDPETVRRKGVSDFVVDVLKNIGKNTLVNVGTQATTHLLGNAINKAAGVASDDVANRLVNPQKGQSDKK